MRVGRLWLLKASVCLKEECEARDTKLKTKDRRFSVQFSNFQKKNASYLF